MNKNYQSYLKELIESFDAWFESSEKIKEGLMSSDLYPYKNIFSPIQVNSIRIKNRIVMGPMGNIFMCDETGRPNNKMIAYFSERAKGGTGLITTGLVPVCYGIDPSVDDTDNLSMFPKIGEHRSDYAGWKVLSERVHSYGSKIFIQLTAGLGRVGPPECLVKKMKLPVSASWNPNFYIPEIPCVRMSDRRCYKIIKNAGQAAIDARELLLDGVYLHGHEGYLLEQMTNPAFNRRKLGKFSDWQAFGVEMVKEMRDRCGKAFPIMYRIDLSLALNETYGDRMTTSRSFKKFCNERTIEMTLDYMSNLVRAGVDLFDVDLGCYDNWWLPHPPSTMPAGCFLLIAKIVKDYFREHRIISNAGLEVPVVAVGKLGNPDLAEKALRDGWCDMVMLARPLLADPYWPAKAYAGKVDEIIPCIGDQEGCLNELTHGGHLQCSVNPRTSFEDVFPDDEKTTRTVSPKKVAVIGAGPAGVTCATTAARRGHNVTLFEQSHRAGGALIAGSVHSAKFDVKNYVEYLNGELKRCEKQCTLNVRFDTKVTPTLLKESKFDTIVTCTGGIYEMPCIEGISLPHVKRAIDILLKPALAEKEKNIVVIGGGTIGCEVAHFLAYEMDKNITVIEVLPYLMKHTVTANRAQLIYALHKKGVKLMNCTRVKRIENDTVIALLNLHKNVPDPYNSWRPVLPENIPNPLAKKIKDEEMELALPAELVIIATGATSDDSLYEECISINAAPEIHNIGDSFETGKVFEATKAGFAIGRML